MSSGQIPVSRGIRKAGNQEEEVIKNSGKGQPSHPHEIVIIINAYLVVKVPITISKECRDVSEYTKMFLEHGVTGMFSLFIFLQVSK
ncbi:MAG: hypothetical protein JW904_05200 [Spirochaetales bacterium]|nr:hypothetical protein [Spirochaetales bacterium]